jgi:hypothetical protein
VTDTPLNRDLAEHRPHRFPECFAAVEDEQDALLGVKATLNEIGEQRGHSARRGDRGGVVDRGSLVGAGGEDGEASA